MNKPNADGKSDPSSSKNWKWGRSFEEKKPKDEALKNYCSDSKNLYLDYIKFRRKLVKNHELIPLISSHFSGYCLEFVVQIDLSKNLLTELPDRLSVELPCIEVINLSCNNFSLFPQELSEFRNIRSIDLSRNSLGGDVHFSGAHLPKLQYLNLSANYIESIQGIGNLKSLKTLILGSECIGGNRLQDLPSDICSLQSLEELGASLNRIKKVPENLKYLKTLKILDLTSNRLVCLPREIGNLVSLRSLGLGQNMIKCLPPELADLTELRTIDMSNNLMESLSVEILEFFESRSVLLAGNPLNGRSRSLTESEFDRDGEIDHHISKLNILESFTAVNIPSLVELSARSIIRNELSFCSSKLPERILHYLVGLRGGICQACLGVTLHEFNNHSIIQDCLGFPKVHQRINSCSAKCKYSLYHTSSDDRRRLKAAKSKLRSYINWQEKLRKEIENW